MDMKQTPRINIELGEKEAEGIYANMVMLGHSPTEMILDFIRVMPGSPKARVQSRIIMTPAHAKMLQRTLEENLKKYEKQFGEIKIHGNPEAMMSKNIGFESSTSSTGEEKE
nr:DUF3467 domain-containing protein [candidate division Zixibacteria bacterium]